MNSTGASGLSQAGCDRSSSNLAWEAEHGQQLAALRGSTRTRRYVYVWAGRIRHPLRPLHAALPDAGRLEKQCVLVLIGATPMRRSEGTCWGPPGGVPGAAHQPLAGTPGGSEAYAGLTIRPELAIGDGSSRLHGRRWHASFPKTLPPAQCLTCTSTANVLERVYAEGHGQRNALQQETSHQICATGARPMRSRRRRRVDTFATPNTRPSIRRRSPA